MIYRYRVDLTARLYFQFDTINERTESMFLLQVLVINSLKEFKFTADYIEDAQINFDAPTECKTLIFSY